MSDQSRDIRRLRRSNRAISLSTLGLFGTFAAQNALSTSTVWCGVLVGAGIMFSTLLSKPLVMKLPAGAFEVLVDGMLIVSGAALVWAAM